MIWYLLYPLRGTTEAPSLAASNPLRRAFTRYGRNAVRHVVTTLLVTTALATILIYPIPFIFGGDSIDGASNLPRHVWTNAQSIPYDDDTEPDIVMRSIWVHADYMQALDKELLASALELQDELLGQTREFDPRHFDDPHQHSIGANDVLSLSERDAMHVVNGLTNESWFFQSPLYYWNCTREVILTDPDIIATVNDRKTQSTPANLILRHSQVFSGKRFEDRRLLAADSLVITLLHRRDSPVGKRWEDIALDLSTKVSQKWDIYPADGRVEESSLYEFQFKPMTLTESLTYTSMYAIFTLYFIGSLNKIKAFKSKIGLIITVLAQQCFAIMGSFTICAVNNVDLSRIPGIAYPFVIQSLSLENIFRLINSIIATASADHTANRIGHAFGATAHIALANTIQNVGVLLLFTLFLVPGGVEALCVFTAVAAVLDFMFLSSFTLAVISIDLRRTELSDALAKSSMQQNGRSRSRARTGSGWFVRFIYGKTAMSTRVAGSLIMFAAIIMAQWHFYDGVDAFEAMFRFCKTVEMHEPFGRAHTKKSLLDHLHQARSPASWLRLQDHETAREVIEIIKPSAFSYIAKVYDPLVFVLKDSNRMPGTKEPPLLPAIYDFIHHQYMRFVILVLIVMSAIRLLIHYLLWEDRLDASSSFDLDNESMLSIKTLTGGHTLDVAKIVANTDGTLVSVGLDRRVSIWDLRGGKEHCDLITEDHPGLFPILAMALDDASRWLVVLSPTQISFWNLKTTLWAHSITINEVSQKPEAFFVLPSVLSSSPRLVMVHQGRLQEFTTAKVGEEQEIGPGALVMATPMIARVPSSETGIRLYIGALSRTRRVSVFVRAHDGAWLRRRIETRGGEGEAIHQITAVPSLGIFVLASTHQVHLVDARDVAVLHSITVDQRIHPRGLQCTASALRSSHSVAEGVASLTICYKEADTERCILRCLVPADEGDAIWLRAPWLEAVNHDWSTWDETLVLNKVIDNPGTWSLLSDGSAVGLRRRFPQSPAHNGTREAADGLRQRFSTRSRRMGSRFEAWETWTVLIADKTRDQRNEETRPLVEGPDQSAHLVASKPGPRADVGLTSVAFAFGDVLKVVTVGGHERFRDTVDEEGTNVTLAMSGRKRRTGRTRAWS